MRHAIIVILFLNALASCNRPAPRVEQVEHQQGLMHPSTPSADNSIYQLGGSWTNQGKKTILFNDLRGKVQVIAMIFTHCQYACPKITADMKALEAQIPSGMLNKVGFVLVSFDSERDTSEQLKSFYDKLNLDEHWLLLHGNEQQVRELSVLLNVSYKKGRDGIYAHSSIITVLDSVGNIRYQQEGLGANPKELLSAINNQINGI